MHNFLPRFVFFLTLWSTALLSPTVGLAQQGAQQLAFTRLVIKSGQGADIRRHEFRVEVAQTTAQRRIGLMYRRQLDEDAGMLFDFDKQQLVSMWMRNTYIPLDMLFIDETGKVINIIENAEPQTLISRASAGPVLAALELAGGVTAKLGIKAGDRVIHPLFGNVPAP